MRLTLTLAGAYNILFGLAAGLLPVTIFALLGMEAPRYPFLFQCIGMIVGVYGVGYLIAASNPLRHWPIVFVGFLGKVFGPLGFIFYAMTGEISWSFGWLILANDIIWLLPFGYILMQAYDSFVAEVDRETLSPQEAMAEFRTASEKTLCDIASKQTLMLVFLRHFGCTFCREMLSDIASRLPELEEKNLKLILVHMSSPEEGQKMFERYGLSEVEHVSDPERRLYAAFELSRGRLGQLFGPAVILRGIAAFFQGGHGVGMLSGDGFQMPGVFLVRGGKVIQEYRHVHAGERPDYKEFASCCGGVSA